ncbi:MAG TPA: extracellular solute-binding protein [Glycomyces sp.]|nr:extracellular solute-binding protein [Glycomyces sp.]
MSKPLHRLRTLAAAGAAVALVTTAAACGDDSGSDADIVWWHIQNQDPMMSTWSDLADEWSEESGLSFNVQAIENEAFKERMGTSTQSGDVPDLFQTWGGGVLAQQVEAGLVQDLTGKLDDCIDKVNPAALDPYTIDGKLYAVPFDAGVVGFWYNKDLFAAAGVEQPPATWAEFLDTVQALKDSGVAPIALAGGDKWPGHYYWTYLAMRLAGLDAMQSAAEAGDFSDDAFVQAGEMVAELAEMEPFQPGFESATYGEADGQAAHMGEGLAGMELMGQWAPVTQQDASGTEGLGDALGFFPFPAVEGGAGAITEYLGGGNGFAVGSDAPDEITDFLCFLLEEDNQAREVADGGFTTVAADPDAVVPEMDANTQAVVDALASATATQLYLDQAYPPAIGGVINEATEGVILGQISSEDMVAMINEAWAAEQ